MVFAVDASWTGFKAYYLALLFWIKKICGINDCNIGSEFNNHPSNVRLMFVIYSNSAIMIEFIKRIPAAISRHIAILNSQTQYSTENNF